MGFYSKNTSFLKIIFAYIRVPLKDTFLLILVPNRTLGLVDNQFL